MLKIIAVDDESTALKWFHRVASKNPDVSIEGEFLYAEDAVDYIKKRPADVAFLDIEMPEMSGLELAERLMEIDPFIKIVFVTAYGQYALDAFRAHAIGYLLKPLDGDEFTEQIELLKGRYAQRPEPVDNARLFVRCFGQFSVSAQAQDTPAIRWKTAKAEELFALLIHHQGRAKSREHLTETLWPELDPKKSANLFRVTCTYLRTTLAELGFPKLLLRELDGYRLNTGLIECDLFRFNAGAGGAQSMEAVAALYSGEYLEGKAYDWAAAAKAQLEADFKRMQYSLADGYMGGGRTDKACEAMERILLYDPCEEAAVVRILQAKLGAGDRAAAVKAYNRYERALKAELGLAPSERLRQMIWEDAK